MKKKLIQYLIKLFNIVIDNKLDLSYYNNIITSIQNIIINSHQESLKKLVQNKKYIEIDSYYFYLCGKISNKNIRNTYYICSYHKNKKIFRDFYIYRSNSEGGILRYCSIFINHYIKGYDYISTSFIDMRLQNFIMKNEELIPLLDDFNCCDYTTYFTIKSLDIIYCHLIKEKYIDNKLSFINDVLCSKNIYTNLYNYLSFNDFESYFSFMKSESTDHIAGILTYKIMEYHTQCKLSDKDCQNRNINNTYYFIGDLIDYTSNW